MSFTRKSYTVDLNLLPKGWRRFACEMIARAEREFRGIVFTEIQANPGGWLSVDIDMNSINIQSNWRAQKLAQGYSSMSFHICAECGSHHGNPHPGHVFPVCEDCRGPFPSNPEA